MPLYEYRCGSCGERFEVIQKFSDPPPGACTKCGKGPVERLLSSPAIQFKGTGWYITDYAQKGKRASDGGGGSDGKPAEGGSSDGGAKGDSAAKPESKGSSDATPSDAPKTSAAEPKPSGSTTSKS